MARFRRYADAGCCRGLPPGAATSNAAECHFWDGRLSVAPPPRRNVRTDGDRYLSPTIPRTLGKSRLNCTVCQLRGSIGLEQFDRTSLKLRAIAADGGSQTNSTHPTATNSRVRFASVCFRQQPHDRTHTRHFTPAL